MFNAKDFLEKNGLPAALEAAVKAAYQAGFDAAIAKVETFVRGANVARSAPASATRATDVVRYASSENLMALRFDGAPAPRGRAREAVTKLLEQRPGLAIIQYEKLAEELNLDVAKKTIGNELRRGEGTLYVRDVPRGNRWFLKGRKNEAAEVGSPAAASFFDHSSQEGGDGHAATLAH